MDNNEKFRTLLSALVSKAVLSQSCSFKLLMRDVLDSGLSIVDAVTILARLQREKALDTYKIVEAINVKDPISAHLSILAPRFNLDHIDENKLNENHVLDIKIFPPFIGELERAKFIRDEIEAIEALVTFDSPPQKLNIHCPIDRSTLLNVKSDDDWKELAKGKIYKCKDRNHAVEILFRDGVLTASFELKGLKDDATKLDDQNGEAVS